MELSKMAACGLTRRALLEIGAQAGAAGDKMIVDMGVPSYKWNEDERVAFDCMLKLARYANKLALMIED